MPQQLRSASRISAEPEGPITVKEHTRHRQRFLRAVIGVVRRIAVRGRVLRIVGGRIRIRLSVAARSRSHSMRGYPNGPLTVKHQGVPILQGGEELGSPVSYLCS